ncbi:MAG: STAS/SEC14 domain-containing protein [Pseudomonadota bacterium]
MATLAPTSSIHADDQRRELYFAIAGFWQLEDMRAFLDDLAKAAAPFLGAKRRFTAMGNLAEFVPQDRATADAIRDSLLLGNRNGLTKFAVVSPPPLVKLQYKRIGAGLDVEFFEDEASALSWLRGEA